MVRSGFGAVLMALALIARQAWAEKKEMKLTKQWSGSVADEELSKNAPEYIADAKSLEKLWNKWRIEDKLPKVDFDKEIVIVSTTVGSRLSLSASLDDKGDLEVLGQATLDIAGFRYVIGTVSLDGIKTVNGKELKAPREK